MARSVDIVRSTVEAAILAHELVPRLVGDDLVLGRRRTVVPEAVDLEVDQGSQVGGEVLDVHAGAAIDVRWILPAQQGDLHGDPNRKRWSTCSARAGRPARQGHTTTTESSLPYGLGT